MAAVEAQWKYELTGDYSEFPPELADYLDEDQLQSTRESFDYGKEIGLRVSGGVPTISVAPLDSSFEDSVAAIRSCYDGRGLVIVDSQEAEIGQGQLIQELAYFRFVGDDLKIFHIEVAEVAECLAQ